MRTAFLTLVAVGLVWASPAQACRIPSFAITPTEQEASGDLQLYRIRTVRALAVLPEELGHQVDLLALEAMVLSGPEDHVADGFIRIIVPDRWGACGQLYDPRATNGAGQIEGYVLLRRDAETGYYETRQRGTSRNRERVLRYADALEWRTVTFRWPD